MKKKMLLGILLIFLMAGIVQAADYKRHPTDCPKEYNFVSCTGGKLQCGIESPGPYCYDMDALALTVPATDRTSDLGDTYQSALPAGYILDCQSTDAAEPYCDVAGAFLCNRNITCYNLYRKSTCIGGYWSNESKPSNCSTCRGGYVNCTGPINTQSASCEVQYGTTNCAAPGSNNNINASCDCVCDGTIATGWYNCTGTDSGLWSCETQNTGVCSVGTLSGTYSCSVGAGGCYRQPGGIQYACTCVVGKSDFQTGTYREYATSGSQSFLWGKDWGTSSLPLMNLSNATDYKFLIDTNACIMFWDGTRQCTAATAGGGDTHEAVYPLANDTSRIWLNDIFVNASGEDYNKSQNIVPALNKTYAIGNATHYIGRIFADILNAVTGYFTTVYAGTLYEAGTALASKYLQNNTDARFSSLVVQNNIYANYTNATQNWSHVNYPVPCPSGSAITELGNAVICTAFPSGNTTSEIMTVVNATAINNTAGIETTNINMTGNITVGINNYICFDNATTCAHYITSNGSALILRVK